MMRAGKDYGVEVVIAYENKRVGAVIYPAGVERERLIRSGFVRARRTDVPADKPQGASINQAKPTLKLT